jgi:hypothetical protein
VANLVMLGTPHGGADLATVAVALAQTPVGRVIDDRTERRSGHPVGATSPASVQLATGSDFLRSLAREPLPSGVRATSIAARGDLVAPALDSVLPGSTHVLVPLDGPAAHGALPGSPLALREVALALSGVGPTCRRLSRDLVVAAAVSLASSAVGDLARPLAGADRRGGGSLADGGHR